MNPIGRFLLASSLAAVVSLGASPEASGEVVIQDVGWQLALQIKKQRRDYKGIERWLFPPSPNVKLRPRALVTLRNRGPKTESAILLRYAFSARLKRIGSGSADGEWTVPFVVEEKHIPMLRGNRTKKVPIQLNRVALRDYLKRMYRAGYWPDAFRVRVLVEPRKGETFDKRIREKTLPVIWKTSSSREEP